MQIPKHVAAYFQHLLASVSNLPIREDMEGASDIRNKPKHTWFTDVMSGSQVQRTSENVAVFNTGEVAVLLPNYPSIFVK